MKNAAFSRQFLKEFFTLATPIIVGNLCTFGTGFVSHFMTSPLGNEASCGIFLSNQVFQLLVFIVTGIEAATSIIGSQSDGSGDRQLLLKTTARSAYLAIFISLLTMIVCISMPKRVLIMFASDNVIGTGGEAYLRISAMGFPLYALGRVLIASMKCMRRTSAALLGPASSLLLNSALSALVINGPLALGASGAGISVLIARSGELLLIVVLFLRSLMSDHGQSGSKKLISKSSLPSRHLPSLLSSLLSARGLIRGSAPYFRALAPIMLGQISWAAESLLLTALMSRVEGGSFATAFGVVTSLSNLAYCFMNGASGAMGITSARMVGEGCSEKDISRAARRGELIFIAAGIFGAALILALSEPFILLYRLTPERISAVRRLIPILAATFVPLSYSAATLFGVIKSSGNVGFTLSVDLFTFILFTLPLSLAVYSLGANAALLYTVLRLGHILKCPIARIRVLRGGLARRLTNGRHSGKILMRD